jgi:hypothetical protein
MKALTATAELMNCNVATVLHVNADYLFQVLLPQQLYSDVSYSNDYYVVMVRHRGHRMMDQYNCPFF